MTSADGAAWMASLLEESHRRSDLAQQIYDALKATGELRSHRLLTYRCALRRCLLLDVIQTPRGLIIHRPGYRHSPTVNEQSSNESGRAANTTDGDRRWKPNTGFIDQWGNAGLECDHVLSVTVELEEIRDAINAGRTSVTVPSR